MGVNSLNRVHVTRPPVASDEVAAPQVPTLPDGLMDVREPCTRAVLLIGAARTLLAVVPLATLALLGERDVSPLPVTSLRVGSAVLAAGLSA